MSFALCSLLSAVSISCASQKSAPLPPKKAKALSKEVEERAAKEAAATAADSEGGEEEGVEAYKGPIRPWESRTFSPRPGSAPDPRLEGVEAVCGVGDASLHEVASLLAQLHAETGDAPNLDLANFHLRRRGSPYVMPRLWSAEMNGVDEEQIAASVQDWASQRQALGEFRCGVGLFRTESGDIAATVLQVDVLADVQPVPTKTQRGTWLELEAALLVPASDASVLLLPPEGPPRSLRTKLSGSQVSARFPIETEGTWLVQLMATVSGGPRPVAQLLVNSDITPPQAPDAQPVPGEKSFDPKKHADDALFEIMNAAREDQGLPPLKRNRRLDRIALEHSRTMQEQGRISHDTGAGNPAYRVEAAGMSPKATGENVALAGSVVRLHRALWASPSHRDNMLLLRWDEVGIAVTRSEDGSLFATELFIDSD